MKNRVFMLFLILTTCITNALAKKEKGSTSGDLKCLQEILNNNPQINLDWVIDTINVVNPNNYILDGVKWSTDITNKRVEELRIGSCKTVRLDVSSLTELKVLYCYDGEIKFFRSFPQ